MERTGKSIEISFTSPEHTHTINEIIKMIISTGWVSTVYTYKAGRSRGLETLQDSSVLPPPYTSSNIKGSWHLHLLPISLDKLPMPDWHQLPYFYWKNLITPKQLEAHQPYSFVFSEIQFSFSLFLFFFLYQKQKFIY